LTLKPFAWDPTSEKKELEYQIAQRDFLHGRAELELNARVRFLEVLRVDKLHDLAKRLLANAEEAQRVTDLRAQKELAEDRDVSKRRLAVLEARLGLLQSQKRQRDAEIAFLRLADLDQRKGELRFPDDLPPPTPATADILAQALTTDSKLAQYRLTLASAQRNRDMAEWSWQSLSLTSSTATWGNSPQTRFTLGFSLNLTGPNQLEGAELALELAKRDLDDRRQVIEDSVTQATANLELQRLILEVNLSRYLEAERNYAGVELRFHQDEVLSIDLDDARLTRDRAQADCEMAKLDLWVQWFQLLALLAG
jgi:outer membrane protein TolC